MYRFTREELKRVMLQKEYAFDDMFMLVGVRKDRKASNAFDDTFAVVLPDKIYFFPCTTDPGKYYLEHGLAKGTAILKPGQYKDAWQLGVHKDYAALVQCRPVTVYRDANKDNTLDYTKPETGLFGINIHRANAVLTSVQVDKWSAGCQVLASPKDFQELLNLCRAVPDKRQYFTYTLLEEADFSVS